MSPSNNQPKTPDHEATLLRARISILEASYRETLSDKAALQIQIDAVLEERFELMIAKTALEEENKALREAREMLKGENEVWKKEMKSSLEWMKEFVRKNRVEIKGLIREGGGS